MNARLTRLVARMRPRLVDPVAFAVVSLALGVGVWFIAWQSETLRLEIEATNLAWIPLVAFGMTWHGEWGTGWRMAVGLVFGALASIGAFYGVMSLLPITLFSYGLAMGVAATGVAMISHAFPRAMSFAAAVVGFGVGIVASRDLPVRPTTPADDLLALMLTVTLALVLGSAGSMALRGVVLRMARPAPSDTPMVRAVTHLLHRETVPKRKRKRLGVEETVDLEPVTVLETQRSGAAR